MTDKVAKKAKGVLVKSDAKTKEKAREDLKKTKLYFTMDTQYAIHDYLTCEHAKERDNIYRVRIKPAFEKLAENLIFMYGFKGKEAYELLRDDCVTFLFEKMGRFDPEYGSKAFSYFNIVARRWLINQSKARVTSLKRHTSMDDRYTLGPIERKTIENYDTVKAPDEQMILNERLAEISKILTHIQGKVTNKNEVKCIEAIIQVFSHVDELDLLNKRAIFVYLRSISGLSPKHLTVALSSIKKHYRVISRTDEFLNF